MFGNPSIRLIIRLTIDVLLLFGIFIIALVALPYWLRSHLPSETVVSQQPSQPSQPSQQPPQLQQNVGESAANVNTMMKTPFTIARRGFFCSDDSLRYPYKIDTVLNKVHMTIITIALPAAVFLIVVLLRAAYKNSNSSSSNSSSVGSSVGSAGGIDLPQKFNFIGMRIPTLISECYQLMGAYLFGLGLLLIAIAFLKHWTGRLRPYFFDVCQPQMADNSNCDDDSNFGIYIENYACSELATVSEELLGTLRQSFPSGYVSCTAYALGFLCVYLQARMRTAWLRLFRVLLQFAAIAILALVAIDRIGSMRNHWTDVCAGIVLGLIFTAFVAFVVLHLFQHIAERPQTPIPQPPPLLPPPQHSSSWTVTCGTNRKKYPKHF